MADRTGIFGQFQFSFFDLHLKFIFDQHKFLLQRAVKLTQVIKLVGRQYTYDLLGHFKDLVMLIVINRKCAQRSRSFDFENTISFVVTEIKMLTGQHFDLCDNEGNRVFEIEGTAPLRTLSVYDDQHNEIFKMTKKIVSVLPTYQFYYLGELYGTLEKKFVLVKDKFEMKVKEGKLELTEYAGSIGHNFCVTLNGKTLGTILDNLDLKMENIVFDNAVIIAYEEKYLPLLAAMAVMVARELARDRS